MTELVQQQVPTREQIEMLQAEMAKHPQFEMTTEHSFSDAGMYCRKLYVPAGTLIVGKVHKVPNFFICAAGMMRVWSEHGVRLIQAGDVFDTVPGTKRVGLALTDCIVINVHKTEHRDLDAIEAEQVEPDESALFDAANLPRTIIEALTEGQK